MKKEVIIILVMVAVFSTFLFFASKANNDTVDVIETENKQTSMEDIQNNEPAGNPVVIFETNKGDIKIELFIDKMPITAGNFLKLVEEGYYDGIKFHRVISNFMIQGGDPLTKDDSAQAMWGTGGPGYAIQDEFVAGLSNIRGTLSMANSGPNTGGSQFFINLVDNINLDFDKEPAMSKHPVFGKVVGSLDVIDAIGGVETGMGDRPVEAIVIQRTIIE